MLRISTNAIVPQRGRKWIQNQSSMQRKEGQISAVLHFQIPVARVLFVANRIVNLSRSLHNPQEGVVVDEGNDYVRVIETSGGRLQLFHKVWRANECQLHTF